VAVYELMLWKEKVWFPNYIAPRLKEPARLFQVLSPKFSSKVRVKRFRYTSYGNGEEESVMTMKQIPNEVDDIADDENYQKIEGKA